MRVVIFLLCPFGPGAPAAADDGAESVPRATSTANPGLRLRLSQAGIDYAASVAVDKMSAGVLGARLDDNRGSENLGGLNVEWTVTDGRVGDC